MTDIGYNLGSAYGNVIISTNVGEAMDTAQRQFESGIAGMSASIQSWGASLTQMGAQLTVLTTPLRGVISTGLEVAGDFDQIMTEIQARTGATVEEMEKIRAEAERLGAESVFSAQQSGEAILQLLTSGMDLESALATLPAVINAATADSADLGRTADVVTNILASFGLEASDAEAVVNSLARASGASKASITSLGDGFASVGNAAKEFGLTFDQTAAILGIFSNNGIQGTEAGTQLRSMLTMMTSDAKPTVEAWDTLGVSLYDAQGNMRDLNVVFSELDAALDKLPMEEQNRLTQDLAGSYGRLGFSALRSGMSIGEMQAKMQDQADASEIAAQMMGTWNNLINSLRGSWEMFLTRALAPTVEEYLKPIINAMIDLVNAMAVWVQENPEIAQTFVILAMVIAAIGPALIGMGLALSIGGAALGLLLSPMTLLIGGLLTLGVVFRNQIGTLVGYLQMFVEDIQNLGLFDAIRSALGWGRNEDGWFEGLLVNLGMARESAETLVNSLHAAFLRGYGMFLNFQRQAGEALETLSNIDLSPITDFLDGVRTSFNQVSIIVDGMISYFMLMRNSGLGFFDAIREEIDAFVYASLRLLGFSQETGTAVRDWLLGAVDTVERLFNAAGDVIGSVWDWLQSLSINTSSIGEIIGPLYEVGSWLLALTNPFSLTFKILTELGVDFIGIIEDIAAGISTFFDVLAGGGTLTDGLRAVFGEEFVNGITGGVDTVTGVINDFMNLLAGLWDFVSPALQNLGNWFLNDVLPAVTSLIQNAVMPALTSIGNFLSKLWEIVSPSLGSFAEWFLYTALPEIQRFISDVIIPAIEGFIQTLTRIWNDVSPFLLQLADWFLNDALPTIIRFINEVTIPAIQGFIDLLVSIWNVVSPVLTTFYEWFIVNGLPFILDALEKGRQAVEGLINILKGIWDSVRQGVEDFKIGLQGMVTWVDTNIVKPIIDGVNSFISVLQNIWPSVRKGFDDFKNGVEGVLGPIWKRLNDIINLVTGAETTVSAGGTLNTAGIRDMAGLPPAPTVSVISTGGGSGFMPGYATGISYVQNQGLAMLHPGERVLTANENAQYGDGQQNAPTFHIEKIEIVADTYEGGVAAARGFKDEMAEEMMFNG